MTTDPLKELTQYVVAERLAGRLTAAQAAHLATGIVRGAYALQGWNLTAVGFRDVLAEVMKPEVDEEAVKKAIASVNAGLALVKEARGVVMIPTDTGNGMVN